MSHYHTQNTRGASFLELLVVLFLLGLILVSMSTLPLARQTTPRKFSHTLQNFLKHESLQAIAAQRTEKVRFDGTLLSGSEAFLVVPTELTLELRFGGSRGNSELAFYPNGFASAGTLTISNAHSLCLITLTFTGSTTTECSDAS